MTTIKKPENHSVNEDMGKLESLCTVGGGGKWWKTAWQFLKKSWKCNYYMTRNSAPGSIPKIIVSRVFEIKIIERGVCIVLCTKLCCLKIYLLKP